MNDTDTAAAPRIGSSTPLPRIISVDDHIVEPAHLWETWLPARFRDRGPKVERRGIGDMAHIGGGTYRQTFDPEGPLADCWVYEDLVYINKRHVAAVGFDRDDMTMSPIIYDEMRPGCYEPKARVADNRANWVEASLCIPTFPRFCGQTFLEAQDKDLAEACVTAYNDFMVEEWCGGISLKQTARTPRAALRRTSAAAFSAFHRGTRQSGRRLPPESPHHSSTMKSL